MSREMVVAKRYAKALFEAASDKGIIAEVDQELKAIVNLIDSVPDFKKFLEHPNIDNNDKINLLKNALEKQVSEIVFNTLQLVITRGRESILPSLLEYYVAVANEALGRADATVYTPYELSQMDRVEISKNFGVVTGKEIHVENVIIDPSLLGGLRVRIGDRLYDGSLSNKLMNLEKTLLQKAL